MLGESTDYDKLSKQSGIDFNALKEKYSVKSSSSTSTLGAEDILTETMQADLLNRRQEAHQANEALSKYRICDTCHGTGIQKYIYNFISMETNCDQCEGEGLIKKKTPSSSSSSDLASAKIEGEDEEDDACAMDPAVLAAVVGDAALASALKKAVSKEPDNTTSMETPD